MRRYNLPKPRHGESKGGKKRSKDKKNTSLALYENMMDQLEHAPLISLHVAVICNAPNVVASLLLKGAPPDRALKGGLTPLHCLFLDKMPPSEDYYPYLSNLAYNAVNFKMIINHLVIGGSRLVPDVCGLTPLTLSVWRRCSIVSNHLRATASCSVDDVIQLLYFSMPFKYSDIQPNTLAHSARLKRALSVHIKHGVTPHKSPIDTTRQFLSCVSATELSDCFEVYASELTSYLALQSTPGTQLFTGVKILLGNSVKMAAKEPSLKNYFPLISSVIRWLSSHTSLDREDTVSCWKLISDTFGLKEVREKIYILVPAIASFLHKLVLPLIDKYGEARPIGCIILFLKIVSDSPLAELIPREEMRDMFHLFNRKHMVLFSLFDCNSFMWGFVSKIEMLDFAMSFMFNVNETIHGLGGTALHVAARSADMELIRYFLRVGVSPLIRDQQGRTFLAILVQYGFSEQSREICKEFCLGAPYRLVQLCIHVYIRNRIPLKHLHKNRILLDFVISHCDPQECRQMCEHCYKKYYA